MSLKSTFYWRFIFKRVIAALENKIDITSFEALVRVVEVKADK